MKHVAWILLPEATSTSQTWSSCLPISGMIPLCIQWFKQRPNPSYPPSLSNPTHQAPLPWPLSVFIHGPPSLLPPPTSDWPLLCWWPLEAWWSQEGKHSADFSFLAHQAEQSHACSVTESCLTLCDPVDCSPAAPLSMGFSRQEY